jgi:hypothetical protein
MSDEIKANIRLVMADLAQAPGAPCSAKDLEMDYVKFGNALAAGQFDLTDDVAFSAKNMKEPPHVWLEVFLAPWPALKWFALKIVSLPCSATACEHSWSIEGWIHSKGRNSLGQKLVEMLVRSHTNMVLQRALDLAKLGVLDWDIELVLSEPTSDSRDSDVDSEGSDDEDDDSDKD